MRQKKQVLLDVRREETEVHDLGDTGAADVAEAGEVGHVGYLALGEQPLEVNSERHKPG